MPLTITEAELESRHMTQAETTRSELQRQTRYLLSALRWGDRDLDDMPADELAQLHAKLTNDAKRLGKVATALGVLTGNRVA